MEISDRGLVNRSCLETSCRELARIPRARNRNLAKRSPLGSLYAELAKRSLREISYTDLERSLPRILQRDLLHRSCRENSCRELVQRFLQKILPRDAKETSCKDLAQRPGEQNGDLAQRSL